MIIIKQLLITYFTFLITILYLFLKFSNFTMKIITILKERSKLKLIKLLINKNYSRQCQELNQHPPPI